jgi:hypothetical protein
MRRFLATVFVTCAAAVSVRGADLPVIASRLVTGPNSHVELTNSSNQPVTAWTLVVTTKEKDGRTRRAVETIDAYLSEVTRDFPGMSSKVDRLMPGQTREIMLDPVPDGATAEVTAVILEDGTATGDPETIASVFEHRVRERDQLREVVQVFDAVLPSARGAAALEELKRRFASSQSSQEESTAHRAAREAVDTYVQRTTAANADAIDQLVRKYADIVRREYDLAERHSHRKTP